MLDFIIREELIGEVNEVEFQPGDLLVRLLSITVEEAGGYFVQVFSDTPGGGTDLACMMGRETTLERVKASSAADSIAIVGWLFIISLATCCIPSTDAVEFPLNLQISIFFIFLVIY